MEPVHLNFSFTLDFLYQVLDREGTGVRLILR